MRGTNEDSDYNKSVKEDNRIPTVKGTNKTTMQNKGRDNSIATTMMADKLIY